MKLSGKQLAAALAAALIFGYWLASSSSSPVGPAPKPDRPVLSWIARTAKSLLWIAIFAEGAPPDSQDFARTRTGDDGYRILEHGRGW